MKIQELKMIDDPYFGTTNLCMFPKDTNLSLVYGKNGSGKTSISNAFVGAKNNDSKYGFVCKDGNNLELTKESASRMYVFNEDYIDKNVKVDSNRIGAIILFGNTGDIEKKITDTKRKIDKEKETIKSIDIDKYHTVGNKEYIDGYIKEAESELKRGWAIREQKIKKNLNKSPVTERVINEILEIDISKLDRDLIIEKYNSKMSLIEKVDLAEEVITNIELDINLPASEEELLYLLNSSFEKRQMSDFARNLLYYEEKYSTLGITKSIISNKEKCCPVCLRLIDDEHNQRLDSIIDEAFDDVVKKTKSKIEDLHVSRIDFSIIAWERYLDEGLVNRIKLCIGNYNSLVDIYESNRQVKLSKIYDSLNIEQLGLEKAKKDLLNSIAEANRKIDEINKAIEKNREIKEELRTLNKEMSAFDISVQLTKIVDLREKERADRQKVNDANLTIDKYKLDIKNLQAESKNVFAAKEEINKELSLVFSSKSRLKLVADDSNSYYYIESKGKRIKLNKLSTGERNLIALIYFFEQMKNECMQGEYFKEECTVVIDDPISSFDFENKLGVCSYLKKVISLILDGNCNSQVVLMSHERDVVAILNNIFEKDNKYKKRYCTLRLNAKSIMEFKCNKKSDYEYILEDIYNFASLTEVDESFESKGNEIRRFLEMYSTFNYGIGIKELFNRSELLECIDNDKLREYYGSKLFWVPLNSASHTMGLAFQYPNFDSFDLFSEEEQIKIARDIICYIYLIHKNHIVSLLGDKTNQIEIWINELEEILIET